MMSSEAKPLWRQIMLVYVLYVDFFGPFQSKWPCFPSGDRRLLFLESLFNIIMNVPAGFFRFK